MGAIGFCCSAISDTCSNSIRVIKTTKQTSTVPITYMSAVSTIVAKDGVSGLLFRGLVTKIISNGCQGILFSVLWRLGQDYMNAKTRRRRRSRAAQVSHAQHAAALQRQAGRHRGACVALVWWAALTM